MDDDSTWSGGGLGGWSDRHHRRMTDIAEELVESVRRYRETGRPELIPTAVDRAMARASVLEQPEMLIIAARLTPPGHPDAVAWLVSALRHNKHREQIQEIRMSARRHRAAAPREWDDAWRRATGSVPRWLKAEQIRYGPPRIVVWMDLLREGPGEWNRRMRIYVIQYRYRWSRGDRSPWW